MTALPVLACVIKTELTIQMDDLAQSNSQVLVLAAINLPWQLDQA